jgi:outer membrane lipoprotein-sorting protein
MTGRRQGAFVAIALAGQLLAASIAAAQQPQPPGSIPNAPNRPSAPAQSGQQAVPLPPPAPLPKTGAPGAAQGGQQAQSNNPLQQLREWLPPFLGGGGGEEQQPPQQQPQQPQQQPKQQAPQQQQAGPGPNLEAKQRALVDKVSAYLTRVQVMSGDFAQIGPDGRQSKGQFYVQKPGKVRFDYDSPSRIDIIADGSSVVVRDRKLATQDVYPLSQTPLRFLLADRIDLLRDTTVTSVSADDTYVTVVVEERQALIGTSRMMMMFGAKDFQLKQWVVTDPQGYDTTVALTNLDTAKRPDPNMFKIDYTQYPN